MKSNTIKASGIKPLNAPRIIYVRTDSDGKPTAVQVPPTITSPRSRRTRHQGNNPHPNPLPTRERGQNRQSARIGPPSLQGRELEGGSKRVSPSTTRKARALRGNTTPAENQLWQHLRKTQIPKYKFTRQYPIGPYIVDFCCRESRLIIELDGGHHATQQEADIARQQDLEAHGYRVIRFWNNEVFENIEGVLFKIVEELENSNPHPNPLPTRERGQNTALVSDGAWVKVDEIENLWKVNDEWWRGPDEEIARLYYVLRLANSQQLTVYLDLIINSWYRQAG